MKIRQYFIVVIFLQLVFSCKDATVNHDGSDSELENSIEPISNTDVKSVDGNFDYLPTSTTNAVYHHKTYSFSYDEPYEQSEWVAYYLDPSDVSERKDYERPYFEIDKDVKTGAAHWRNYKKSGYTKGHLCPAADRIASEEDYTETFLTSNISPQNYEFNAGVWNRLEQKVRYWATKNDGLYVVTGGVLTDGLETIGFEDVAVPKYFYKVLLSKDKSKMIGFLVPHNDSKKPLYDFVVSVDSIEEMTGIDFFPKLDDTTESKLESQSDYKGWSF